MLYHKKKNSVALLIKQNGKVMKLLATNMKKIILSQTQNHTRQGFGSKMKNLSQINELKRFQKLKIKTHVQVNMKTQKHGSRHN